MKEVSANVLFTMTYLLRCLRTPTISEYRVKVENLYKKGVHVVAPLQRGLV